MTAHRTAWVLALALLAAGPPGAGAAVVHASYFYHYMPYDHLDSLAAAGFDRAAVRWITDSLGSSGVTRVRDFVSRGITCKVDVSPGWSLQALQRLSALPTTRRYTWSTGGAATREAGVGCPLDSVFWHSVLIDRAEEFMAAVPNVHRLVLDLEIYTGSRHHYDAGPCRCDGCIRDYLRGLPAGAAAPTELSGLPGWEESRLTTLLQRLLAPFAARHPGVGIDVFDLDFDSFVHRAMARALARNHIPTADWTERTYSTGSGPLPFVQARLAALGLGGTPVIGGLWLKRWSPDALPGAARDLASRGGGWFAFTTYSLWQDPAKLTGPYTLPAPAWRYWGAFRTANAP